MNDMISPDNHFVSNDVQTLIRSYRGCPTITSNGAACRSSLTTNKFTDPITGKKWNCNYYCMRQCTPEKLSHIFKHRPNEIITSRGDRLKIGIMEITFFSELTFEHVEFTFAGETHEGSGEADEKVKGVRGNERSECPRKVPENEMSEQLCRWIKSIPENEAICVFVTISPRLDEVKKFRSFVKFDIPYLRPANEWEKLSSNVTIEFQLSNPTITTSKKHSRQKTTSRSVSREHSQSLSIRGMNRPESLVYHGISHPDIHRVSRKNRPESHYRPRHFHSPDRKYETGRPIKK